MNPNKVPNQMSQPQNGFNQPNEQPSVEDPGKTLGVVAVIFSFFMPLIGLILGIISRSRSKKAGYSGGLGLVGAMLSGFWIVVGSIGIIGVLIAARASLDEARTETNKANQAALDDAAEELNTQANNDQKIDEDEQAPVASNKTFEKDSVKCDGQIKVEKLNFTFDCPEGWSYLQEADSYSGDVVVEYITLRSSDFKEENVGYGGSKTGAEVVVRVEKVDKTQAGYNSIQDIIDGKAVTKLVLSEIKPVSIAGKKGVSYKAGYEGPMQLHNIFEDQGYKYSIYLEQDIDGPKFNDYLGRYRSIVDSLELN